MNPLKSPERITQNRVLALFKDVLKYRYLGDWSDREGNSNIDEGILSDWLTSRNVPRQGIAAALHRLRTESMHSSRGLYGNNQAVYALLRYGVSAKTEAGKATETVHLVDWKNPQNNDFAIAEEVTLKGRRERRPDLVLYVNGIAIGVIELKSSRVSIGDGIRQNLSNQSAEFNEAFFGTVQFVFAGNDSEGLAYGTIQTEEKYYLRWKEDEHEDAGYKLDKYLAKMCRKERLIELMHDFVLFDGGIKKLPRPHQYFGLKAAQTHVREKRGGIIWHTQGAGKSILMVLLAKWILENNANARVVIVTDRDELDKQIEGVLQNAGVISESDKVRANSGRDLMTKLGQATPRLVCSLVHKFGHKGVDDFERFIKDLSGQPSPTVGEVFVFVDECHRTQSGKLHRTMKALMPNAVFMGFTGTPLLKQDKSTSQEVFGSYIHTYKFSEAVEDGVVLDLVYEARDIDQRLGSQERVDAWFESRTRPLNDWQKEELKKQWGTLQNVLSSRSRMEKVVNDILLDFSTKRRLSSERGTAMLVASSIYEACKYFELFQRSPLKNRCAIITSYDPQSKDITTEETGANTETDKQFIFRLYTDLLKDTSTSGGKSRTEVYEDEAKRKFIKEPASMRLLVVVDKLLTGFDAPSCTYLYIDKSMRDHGLFQAICRTNRLDGEDKDFGYIVDYKDLFKNLVNDKGTGALQVYTSELDQSAPGASGEVLVQDRLKKGRERLDEVLEALALLCEPVPSPKSELEYIHFFCGNTEVPTDLREREPHRAALYKGVVALLRAYASIADELEAAGYSSRDIAGIKRSVEDYVALREVIRKASGETIDLKSYEADMRHLIDTYIQADDPRKISPFDQMGLLELIVKSGVGEAIARQLGGLKGNKEAIAETIENNVRSKIIKDHLNDPAFYEKMSELLDQIIAARKSKAIEYEQYLKQIAELARKVDAGMADNTPATLDTQAKRAIHNNLIRILSSMPELFGSEHNPFLDAPASMEEWAIRIDETIKRVRPSDWRGDLAKERTIQGALYSLLPNVSAVEELFQVIKAQKEY
ncbi:MAG: HsdR family type I site-specific deoxyribonuclease [Fibrobacteres bacterium]|nr:HsdR family type I site-specific deoxyribonuclease [Fibrobacterota bacterium]